MQPVIVIVWTAVAVFAATSTLALLYLAGFVPRLRPEHGKHLFKILIAQVAVASVSAFTYYVQAEVRRDDSRQLPISDAMLVEQDPALLVKDGSQTLFIRSPDVSRARRVAEIQIDTRADFTTSSRLTLEPSVPQVIEVSGNKYKLSYWVVGALDADPREKQSKSKDFVLLSVKRDK